MRTRGSGEYVKLADTQLPILVIYLKGDSGSEPWSEVELQEFLYNLRPVFGRLWDTTELWVLLVAVALYWAMTERTIFRVSPKVPRWVLLIVAILGAVVIVYGIKELNIRI